MRNFLIACIFSLGFSSVSAERMVSPAINNQRVDTQDLAIRLNFNAMSIDNVLDDMALAGFLPEGRALLAPSPRINLYTPEPISRHSLPIVLHMMLQGLSNLSLVTVANEVQVLPTESRADLPWVMSPSSRVWAGTYPRLSTTTRHHLAAAIGLQAIAGQYGSMVYAGEPAVLSSAHTLFAAMNQRQRAEVRVVTLNPERVSVGLRAIKEYLALTPADLVVDVSVIPSSNSLLVSAPDMPLMIAVQAWLQNQSFIIKDAAPLFTSAQLLSAPSNKPAAWNGHIASN